MTHPYQRKASAVLVLIWLVVLTAGCARPKPEEEKPREPEPPRYAGTLTLHVAPGLAGYHGPVKPEPAWFSERARAFEALHPGIAIQIQVLASPAELEASLLADDAPQPDLAFGRYLPGVASRLADLETQLTPEVRNSYRDNALAAFQTGGRLHGVPALLEVPVLALNLAALREAGVTRPPDGVWSYAEFEASLRRLSANGHHGLIFYHLEGYREWYPLAGGLFSPDGSIRPDAAAGLLRLQQYREQGWIHPDTAKLSAADTWKRFGGSQPAAAIMPVSPWAIPLLRAAPYQIDLGIAGFPDGLTTGFTYGFSVYRQTEPAKLRAVIDLALFMAAPEQQILLARQTGLMPAARLAGNPFAGDEAMTQAFALTAHQQPLPAGPVWDRAEATLARELHPVLLGTGSPIAALKAVKAHFHSAGTPK